MFSSIDSQGVVNEEPDIEAAVVLGAPPCPVSATALLHFCGSHCVGVIFMPTPPSSCCAAEKGKKKKKEKTKKKKSAKSDSKKTSKKMVKQKSLDKPIDKLPFEEFENPLSQESVVESDTVTRMQMT